MNSSHGSVEFTWLSPLGVSVVLFLVCGALYVVIGALTPVMMDSEFGRKIMMMSNRTDTQFFGEEPSQLLVRSPELSRLRSVMAGFIGGILVALGVLVILVDWFGLRNHQIWALAALSGTGLLMIPFWYASFRPYLSAGISFTLSDLPPIFWIPALLLLPATALGWLGLRQGF